MMGKTGKIVKPLHGWALLYISLFLIVCMTPLLGLLTGYENPNLEKRSLAPLPALMADGRPNLALPRNFEDYYADHFAFRSWLISGYNSLNQTVLAQSGNKKVIAGKDRWLFFAETLPDYLAMPTLSPAQLSRLATILSLQQEVLSAKGIDFYFVVAPNKNSIYGEYMPDRFKPVQASSNLDLWLASPYRYEVSTIDLLTPLRQAAASATEPIYHKTDSHWNNLGARIACQVILAEIARQAPGFAYEDYQMSPYTTRTDWQGDLAAMLYPSGVQLEKQYYFDIPEAYRTLKPMRSLEDLLIQTSQKAGSAESGMQQERPLRLLMFRDSFANALIPFLANSFSAATFTREIPYNYSTIDQDKPDVVILEIVERNLPNLLQRAPILLAPERTMPEAAARAGFSADNQKDSSPRLAQLTAEPGKIGLKISGRLMGEQAALDAIGPIYLGLAGEDARIRYFEAFPVDETGQASATGLAGMEPGVLGLTAYLPDSAWTSGLQPAQVWLQSSGQWQRLDCEITLP